MLGFRHIFKPRNVGCNPILEYRMKIFKINSDGNLTKNITKEVGNEFKIKDRIKYKFYGIGHLTYKSSSETILEELCEKYNNLIKYHFDWTENGAVIRIRTSDNNFAIGIKEVELSKISLTKQPDYIFAFPFLPFWILLKLGVPFYLAKIFRCRYDLFYYGKCEILISLNNDAENINFELNGDLWNDCLKTFRNQKTKEQLLIDDRRTWVTKNGIKINVGTATNSGLFQVAVL